MGENPLGLSTGGEKIFRKSAKGTGISTGGITGAIILAFTIAALGIDVALGPNFLNAQAASNGLVLEDLGKWVPWIFSLATTGVLYALWELPGFARKKWVLALGGTVAVLDTLLDVGGFNTFLYSNDSRAGDNIFLPPGAPGLHWFFDCVIFLVCLAHEPLLGLLLSRRQHKLNEIGDTADRAEAFFVYLAGLIFNGIRSLSVMFGAGAMWALDLVLTPQYADDAGMKWGVFAASLVLSGVQVAAWSLFAHVGGARELLKLEVLSKVLLLGGIVAVLIDTGFDLGGYNNLLYGSSDLIVSDPTLAWWVTIAMLAIMCTGNELLSHYLFRPLGRDDDGGDMGDMFMGDDPLGMGDMPMGMDDMLGDPVDLSKDDKKKK